MNGLYVAAAGAASQLRELETATTNLANSSTPGFRRFLDVMRAVAGNGSPFQYATIEKASLDMAQGPIRSTDNPLDVAIAGPAFITVTTPQGPAYTRNGEMQVAADGTLMTAGQPVSGIGGAPLRLPPGPVAIATDGSLSAGGIPVGRIALADPTGVAMESIGGSLYRPANGATLNAITGSTSQLHQGSIEGSTGSDVSQMVALMNVNRSYEAAMHSVQSIDQNEDRAIQAFTLQG